MKRLLDWFVDNPVAATLLTLTVAIGGLLSMPGIKEELFPDISPPLISVSMAYPGAGPRQVEEGICIKIEEAVHDLDGIHRLVSRAAEGIGTLTIELEAGMETTELLEKIKTRVDAIDTFPEEAEQPVITDIRLNPHVVNVALSGDAGEAVLKRLGERLYDELNDLPEVSRVVMVNARPYEISIEVSEESLRRHELTFDEVVAAVRRSSVELPGGRLRTEGSEILLRSEGKAQTGPQFADLPLRTLADGSRLRVGDVARVVDGFEELDVGTRINGKPALILQVFCGPDQGVLDVADAVEAYLPRARESLPPGIRLDTYWDNSRILRGRLDLLVNNGLQGLGLIFATLLLFFRFRLAFFVGLGMLVAVLGTLWAMPLFDSTINMISLFAFIVVLGMLDDHVVVISENIYRFNQLGMDPVEAAKRGVREVAMPMTLAVLSTVSAFLPMMMIPGIMGEFIKEIPRIVILCLCFSLVDALLCMPAHLRHVNARETSVWSRVPDAMSGMLERFVRKIYAPLLMQVLRRRYAAAAAGAAILAVTVGLVAGGRIKFTFFPPVESDYIVAWVTMPPGTPAAETDRVVRRLEEAARRVAAKIEGDRPGSYLRLVVASTGTMPVQIQQGRSSGVEAQMFTSPELGEVVLELVPGEEREIRMTSDELIQLWEEAVGPMPADQELNITSDLMVGGKPIDIQLSAPDMDRMAEAAEALKDRLRVIPGLKQVADSLVAGKTELKLTARPEAEAAGLSEADLARQVRQGYHGEEAQRIQRGREEVKVMVRYPAAERRSRSGVESMRVRAADGSEVPFSAVAHVRAERGPAVITRADRRRSVSVTANLNKKIANANEVMRELDSTFFPDFLKQYPGVVLSLEGRQRQQEETMSAMKRTAVIALLLIYAPMAIPFRSYLQPLLVMLTIPFGAAGAVWAHKLMGMDLSFMSLIGMVALAGVVVDNAMILIDFTNHARAAGAGTLRAVVQSSVVRFRPIFLTTLTTFFGLAPIIFEKSMQAQFLIPMGVSLAFGLVFGTFITLGMVPIAYLILEDLKRWWKGPPLR